MGNKTTLIYNYRGHQFVSQGWEIYQEGDLHMEHQHETSEISLKWYDIWIVCFHLHWKNTWIRNVALNTPVLIMLSLNNKRTAGPADVFELPSFPCSEEFLDPCSTSDISVVCKRRPSHITIITISLNCFFWWMISPINLVPSGNLT